MTFCNSSYASLPSFFTEWFQSFLSQKVIGDGEWGLWVSTKKHFYLHFTSTSKLHITLLTLEIRNLKQSIIICTRSHCSKWVELSFEFTSVLWKSIFVQVIQLCHVICGYYPLKPKDIFPRKRLFSLLLSRN